MILILIRHGKTEANERRLYCGSTDIMLSEAGKEELENKNYSFDLSGFTVLTSGMKRCEQTLSLLFGDVSHETDASFREMDFGAFEMRSYEELKNDPAYLTWISGDNEANTAPGGESGEIMTERVLRGLAKVIGDGKDALVVTHGGVIAAVMAYLFPEESKSRYDWQPPCGGGYRVNLGDITYTLFE